MSPGMLIVLRSLEGFLLLIYVIFHTVWGDQRLPFFWGGGFLQFATAYTPKWIFTKNTSKDVIPAKDVPFEDPNDDN